MTDGKSDPVQTLPASADWIRAPDTRRVMSALTAGGGTARFVGGCVRDTLMGRPIADIDIATPMHPDAVIEAVTAAGLKAIPTGLEHGTVTVVADGKPFEVTTLRRDVETDGRHAVVAFTEDWKQDAARRDFTVNALSANVDGRIYDYFGGIDDARAGRVRFVGDPVDRITEDVLRLLRFFRFYAQIGAPPADPDALEACCAMAGGIENLSGERVRVEVLKLLGASDPLPAWRLMIDTGVSARTIGEPGDLDRLTGLLSVSPDCDPLLRLSALLTRGDDGTVRLADRLKTSRAERDRLIALADRGADMDPAMTQKTLRHLIYRTGGGAIRDRILLAWANDSDDARYRALAQHAQDWKSPRFPLKGRDALALGMASGPKVGDLLEAIEEDWIAEDFASDRAGLLTELKRRVGEDSA